MADNTFHFRFDIEAEILDFDEKSGAMTLIFRPNPRRYEWIERGGERLLHDKLDHRYFPAHVLRQLWARLEDMPVGYQPPMLDDVAEYRETRIPLIVDTLQGHQPPPTFEDKSEQFLRSLAGDELAFVILSLDIVGSTKLSLDTDGETYVRLVSTTLYELSEIVPKYHGYVLKYTGDGFIAYFPEPSFATKNDLAMDCAATLRWFVYKGLNPVFEEYGLPTLGVRIGLDAGHAYVVVIGSPETKQHTDIIGAVVSLACKIQAQARPGAIYLGDEVWRTLHTSWRLLCEPVDLREDWNYRNSEGNVYALHRLRLER